MTSHNRNQRAVPAEQLREQATVIGHDVQQLGTIARSMAQDSISQGRQRAQAMGKHFESAIRDNPVRAILIAAGAGFLASFLFGRRLL